MTGKSGVYVVLVLISCTGILMDCNTGLKCPDEWEEYEDDCYYVSGFSASWLIADKTCRQLDAHLPRITSSAQNAKVLELAYTATEPGPPWLDLAQDDSATPFLYTDGTSASYTNWASGEPSDKGKGYLEEDCVTILGGEWYDVDCGDKYQAACQVPATTGACPSIAWTLENDICYQALTTTKDFEDQVNACTALDASAILATVPSSDVNDILKTLMTSSTEFFIGLQQNDASDEFLWGDGTDTTDYDNYASSQPNDASDHEDCVVIRTTGGGNWYDVTCELKRDVVCVKPALCVVGDLDPTWASVSHGTAQVGKTVQVTCQSGMVHTALKTSTFIMECKSDYTFDSCSACADGCTIDQDLYKSFNLEPLDQQGLLENDDVKVQCPCNYRTSDRLSEQTLSCVNGNLTTVNECIKCFNDTDCLDEIIYDQHLFCNLSSQACECLSGYRDHEPAKLCVDYDECLMAEDNTCTTLNATYPGVANGTCDNTLGSYTCFCPEGFEWDRASSGCIDIHEEELGICDCDDGCVNRFVDEDGIPYECNCDSLTGFELGLDGKSCVDTNECSENILLCRNSTNDPNSSNAELPGICINTPGSYTCICPNGYTLTDFNTCQDIDECSDRSTYNVNCVQTDCYNVYGGYSCGCIDSYVLIDGHCFDVNECDAGAHHCNDSDIFTGGIHGICRNTVGSYVCDCEDGYYWNGTLCLDINECDTELPCQEMCANYAVDDVANNPEGLGYKCSCTSSGLKLSNDLRTCIDIDECVDLEYVHACSNGTDNEPGTGTEEVQGTCVNTYREYSCVCEDGYLWDGIVCTDVDECEENNGGCQFNCTNNIASYTCTCDEGYVLSADEHTCIDTDECTADDTNVCQHTCHNAVGTYSCSCFHGYEFDESSVNCINVDECEENNGGCSQICHDTTGSFYCECEVGYEILLNNSTCVDLNECDIEGNNECAELCINTDGSYKCDCPEGFTLDTVDGVTCEDVDECEKINGGCAHVCNNFPGGYNCSCDPGHSLLDNNWQCDDVDECAGENDCDQLCVNQVKDNQYPNGYSCDCNEGWTLANDNITCENVNECTERTHLCSHICVDTIGSYSCKCEDGYQKTDNGYGCIDIDECRIPGILCEIDNRHQCVNQPGTYFCDCDAGFSLYKEKDTCLADNNFRLLICFDEPWSDDYYDMTNDNTVNLKDTVEPQIELVSKTVGTQNMYILEFEECENGKTGVVVAVEDDLSTSGQAKMAADLSETIRNNENNIIFPSGNSGNIIGIPALLTDNEDAGSSDSSVIEDSCDFYNAINYCPQLSTCELDDDGNPYCRCLPDTVGDNCEPGTIPTEDNAVLIASLSALGGLVLIAALLGICYACINASTDSRFSRLPELRERPIYRKQFLSARSNYMPTRSDYSVYKSYY